MSDDYGETVINNNTKFMYAMMPLGGYMAKFWPVQRSIIFSRPSCARLYNLKRKRGMDAPGVCPFVFLMEFDTKHACPLSRKSKRTPYGRTNAVRPFVSFVLLIPVLLFPVLHFQRSPRIVGDTPQCLNRR